MVELTAYEVHILRECNGELPASDWGAAVGVALETLQGAGFLTRRGIITEAGKKWLEDNRAKF